MKQAIERIDLSEIHKQKSPKNEPSKKDPPKEESPEGLSSKEDEVPENNEISNTLCQYRRYIGQK